MPDAGNGFGDLNIAAKGIYNFDLVVHGKAHHGSRPWEGDGAANKLVFLLSELINYISSQDHEASTITVTKLSGGDADNRGPSEAGAHIDIRFATKEDLVRIKTFLDRLKKSLTYLLSKSKL